ncbi:MAG TPA: glycine cleavage system protein GcvH [Caldilineaceae bacterium]|nr:glycine cleavage system protein GcvH [Caldilineaceae bacterium]
MAEYKLDQAARYAKTHEWVRLEGDLAVVGISDAAQDMLSDVVYVELPDEGRTVTAGEPVAIVESVKAAEEVITPVSGTIVAVNSQLADKPELVNGEPYTAWFFKLRPTAALDDEVAALMDPASYATFAEAQAH